MEFYEVALKDIEHDIQKLSKKQNGDESLLRRSVGMFLRASVPKGKETEAAISLRELAQKAETSNPDLSFSLRDAAKYVENCAE